MTISESLLSLTTYPIPVNTIEKICINRGLDKAATYTATSQSYELAEADVWFWLYGSPNISEQEISFSDGEKEKFLELAMAVYLKYEDSKYIGQGNYGYKTTW